MKWATAQEEAAYLSAVLDNPRHPGENVVVYVERIADLAKALLARKGQPHEAHEWRVEL